GGDGRWRARRTSPTVRPRRWWRAVPPGTTSATVPSQNGLTQMLRRNTERGELVERLGHLPVGVLQVTEQRADPRAAVLHAGDPQLREPGEGAVADQAGDHVRDLAVAEHHPAERAHRGWWTAAPT